MTSELHKSLLLSMKVRRGRIQLASDVRQRKRIQRNLSKVKEDHRGPKTSLKLMQKQQDCHFLVMEAEAEEHVKNVKVEVKGEEEQGVSGLLLLCAVFASERFCL